MEQHVEIGLHLSGSVEVGVFAGFGGLPNKTHQVLGYLSWCLNPGLWFILIAQCSCNASSSHCGL